MPDQIFGKASASPGSANASVPARTCTPECLYVAQNLILQVCCPTDKRINMEIVERELKIDRNASGDQKGKDSCQVVDLLPRCYKSAVDGDISDLVEMMKSVADLAHNSQGFGIHHIGVLYRLWDPIDHGTNDSLARMFPSVSLVSVGLCGAAMPRPHSGWNKIGTSLERNQI